MTPVLRAIPIRRRTGSSWPRPRPIILGRIRLIFGDREFEVRTSIRPAGRPWSIDLAYYLTAMGEDTKAVTDAMWIDSVERLATVIDAQTVTLVAATGERLATFLTTDEGFFSLETDDPGPFLVRATALGYAPARAGPLEMTEGSLQVVELRMTAAPIGIEGLVVEGEGRVGNYLTQKGFWERYQEGRGQFLTPGEVVASDAMFTPHCCAVSAHRPAVRGRSMGRVADARHHGGQGLRTPDLRGRCLGESP